MTLLDEAVALLGKDRVMSQPLERHLYGMDAGVSTGPALLIVFPENTEEVASLVRLAADHGVPVVPRGAGTGLAGGAVPAHPSMLVVLTRMNRIHEVDTAEPDSMGRPWCDQPRSLPAHHPARSPLRTGPVLPGGMHHRWERGQQLGGPALPGRGLDGEPRARRGDGDRRWRGRRVGLPAPDPIGLDLRGVVVGSEGTLGVVTRVLVRLLPNPPAVKTLLLAYDRVEDAAATVSGVIAQGMVPAALEMMDKRMIVAVENFVHADLPVGAEAILLAEVAGTAAAVEDEAALVEEVARANNATQVRIAKDEAERQLLWKGRKSAFGAVAQAAPDYYLHDTVVPRTKLVEVLAEVYGSGSGMGSPCSTSSTPETATSTRLMAFDGSEPGMLERVKAAADELVEVCVAAGGVLSGEHGIGLEKRDLMPLLFTTTDLDAQARVRESFDPEGRLNPDKVLPLGSRCFDLGRPIPEGAWV